jgi:four helix bundle protein
MRNFKELKIWQKGLNIAVDTYKLTAAFPSSEKFGLHSQMTRAAVSIPSNIAEGSSRKSDKDYGRFLEMSLGSSFELETQLLIAKAVMVGDKTFYDSVLNTVIEEQKMISSFINTLRS